MVAGLLNDPQNAVPPGSLTSILWINDGAIGNFGWIKQEGIDFSLSYDYDAGELGAFQRRHHRHILPASVFGE
jgi:hypothetical protein